MENGIAAGGKEVMSVFRCRQIELWDICPSNPINRDLSLQP